MELVNGKRVYIINGYRVIYYPEYADFSKGSSMEGYAYEHRVVIEKSIGRKLSSDEHVHHKDENRLNNNLSNLEILSASEHSRLHATVPEELHDHCEICGAVLRSTKNGKKKHNRFCPKCYSELERGKCPQKEVLEVELSTKTQEEVAKIYGVTNTAVRKWIAKLGIAYSAKTGSNTAQLLDSDNRKKGVISLREFYKHHVRENANPIVKLSLDGVFISEYASIYRASKEIGVKSEAIRKVCEGRGKTCRGFLWMYKSDFEEKSKTSMTQPEFEM